MANELTEEHYKLYPLSDPSCKLCQLPVEDIKKLHHFKFIEEYSYIKMRETLKTQYGMGSSMTELVAHFTKHTSEGSQMGLAKKVDLKVACELEKMTLDKEEVNAKNIQTAYDYLTQTCMELSESSSKIILPYLEYLKEMSPEKIKEKIDKRDPLKSLEQMARIQKLISEHVQTISSMRAPKVVVTQFLELAINEIIRQTGYIFAEVCKTIQLEIDAEIDSLRTPLRGLGENTYKRVFNKAGTEWKNAMTTMKRDQMSRAIDALAELEKII